MLGMKYLYLGGFLDGQWREPPDVIGRPIPEQAVDPNGAVITYVPTKFGQMADAGEFRLEVWAMLERSWHDVLTNHGLEGERAHYRRRLERSLLHQAMRLHMQRIWRVPEVLEFGPAWLAMETRPVPPRTRPIRDNPQA